MALELAELKKEKLAGFKISEHCVRGGNVRKIKHSCFSDEQVAAFDVIYQKMRQLNDTRNQPRFWPIPMVGN